MAVASGPSDSECDQEVVATQTDVDRLLWYASEDNAPRTAITEAWLAGNGLDLTEWQ
jgi:hypothetical protein